MTEQPTNDFLFHPRPEAHAMKWDELLPPIKRAVRDLLIRLDGAERIAEEAEVADCFLVYGSRGTGKTTVLLSAQEAIHKQEGYFTSDNEHQKKPEEEESADEKSWREEAKNSAKKIRDIVWLDILDLEPLPPETNLLTTVLTRVRNALDKSGSEQKSSPLTSPFEEDANSARQLLGRLINDATLMWEDIQEPDTRSRANRQVAAAVIYADFRERFKKAMKELSKELGRRHGSQTEHRSIVLPIDNIDRSTDHLYAIIKLAQMVSCRHLWLVMAGDYQDIDSFLERAYWKELIRIKAGAGAMGKKGPGGEDEAFVMARRQAAAAIQKLLPPSHRIEIQLVDPIATLKFRYGGDKSVNRSTFELLGEIPLSRKDNKGTNIVLKDLLYVNQFVDDTFEQQSDCRTLETKYQTLIAKQAFRKDNVGTKISLEDLLYVQQFVDDTFEQQSDCRTLEPKYLTLIAKQALNLPARGVIDLWQLAYWAVIHSHDKSYFKAEKIARTMLTNAIAGSELTSKKGLILKKYIRHGDEGETILYVNVNEEDCLMPAPLSTEHVRFRFQTKPLPCKPDDEVKFRHWIAVLKDEGIVMSLGNPSKPRPDDELPPLVGAWVAVLYDILTLENRNATISQISSKFITTRTVAVWSEAHIKSNKNSHFELSQQNWYYWPMPNWGTFQSYDVFRQLWNDFLISLKLDSHNLEAPLLIRDLAFGLVSCVLKTFAALAPKSDVETEKKDKLNLDDLGGVVDQKNKDDNDMKKGNDVVENHEYSWIGDIADLYLRVKTKTNKAPNQTQGYYNWSWMQDYLEIDLPLMLSQLLILLDDEQGTKNNREWWDKIWKSETLKDLQEQWEWSGYDQNTNRQIIKALKSFNESTYPPVQYEQPKSYSESLVQDKITQTKITQWENEVNQFRELLERISKREEASKPSDWTY